MEILILLKGFLLKNRRDFIFSFLAVSIGVWGMLVVISIINGFDTELINSLLGFYPHIIIRNVNSNDLNLKNLDIENIIYFNLLDGFVFSPKGKKFASLMEINSLNMFDKFLVKGRLRVNLIGSELAKNLKIDVGDKVTFYYPSSKIFSVKTFHIDGIFETGIYSFDSSLLVTKNDKVKNLIGLYIKNPKFVDKYAKENLKNLSFITWKEANRSFEKALQVDKFFTLLITLFVVMMTGFSLSNSIMYSIITRRREMAILFSLGMNRKRLMNLFIIEGIIISTIGFFVGLITSLITIKIVQFMKIPLPSDVFYMDYLPAQLTFINVFLSYIFVLIISVFFSLLSVRKSLKFNIVEVLSGEE